MTRGAAVPALVTVHLWGVRPAAVPAAVLRMGLDRGPVRRTPGLRFAKLLGTGDGRTFTVRDADPLHWGLLAAWDDPAAAAEFETSRPARGWARLARERLRVDLAPLASRGSWSGQTPFGDPSPAANPRWTGPVAAVTRARIATRRARRFWRSVPPVSADLNRAPGVLLSLGIGEAPVGLQGTFSIWASAEALGDFAYRRAPHAEVVRRTPGEGWYREELFARFAVLGATGTFARRPVHLPADPAAGPVLDSGG